MPDAQFEEKQFETSANIELGLQHAAVFAAGQVLEAVVGYDAAARPPQNAPIWTLMGVANAPTGLQLVPNLWQRAGTQPKAPKLPSTYVSVMFQYKRPQYLSTGHALQWHHWKGPYFRFPLYGRQQHTLQHLETALKARAVVRYACAAFWRYTELQMYQSTKEVLTNSTFVSPSSLVGHEVWTYTTPGTAGYANPNGKAVRTQGFHDTWMVAKELSDRRKESLFQHLRGLANEIGVEEITVDTRPPWLTQYGSETDLNIAQRQAVLDTLELATESGRAGASWFVVDLEVPTP
jgi:hypothetical protein